jgi:DNA-binding transcriptional ArsR family regulator
MSEIKRLTLEFLKLLADPVRLEILSLLEKSSFNSSDLQKELGRSQSTTSKHLNMLLLNDIIDFERRENVKYYRIKNNEVIELINDIISTVLNINKKKLKGLQNVDVEDVLSP